MKTTYNFLQHQVSGDVATVSAWWADYVCMSAEDWYGKEDIGIDHGNWAEAGDLKPIELTSNGRQYLTNRVFSGWWGDVAEGEGYLSEWATIATDEDGERYQIVWQFPAVKGQEPDDDGWPWGDEEYIRHVTNL